MRTTLTIDDDLYRRTKEAAARRGCSVGSVIEEALALHLAAAQATQDIPPLPVFPGGPLPGFDVTSNAAMWELFDDEDYPLDALR